MKNFRETLRELTDPKRQKIANISIFDYDECTLNFVYDLNGQEKEETHLKVDIAEAIGLDVQSKNTEFMDGCTMTYESLDFIEGVLDHEFIFTKDDIRKFIEGGLNA